MILLRSLLVSRLVLVGWVCGWRILSRSSEFEFGVGVRSACWIDGTEWVRVLGLRHFPSLRPRLSSPLPARVMS